MSERLEDFLKELPAKGVPEHAVTLYRTVLEGFEEAIGRAAQLRFSKYEINKYVAQRKREGASERELKNLETACLAYLSYCEVIAPPPPPPLPGASPTAGPAPSGPFTGGTAAVGPLSKIDQKKIAIIGIAVGAVVLLLFGGCIADHVRQSRVTSRFSNALFKEGKRVRTRNVAQLRARVMELAKEHGVEVEPAGLAIGIGPLGPDNMNKLPPTERMTAMQAMQGQASMAMPMPGAPGLGPPGVGARGGRRRAPDAVIWYVEINVLGEIPGLLGAGKLDLAHHLVAGGNLPVPPPDA